MTTAREVSVAIVGTGFIGEAQAIAWGRVGEGVAVTRLVGRTKLSPVPATLGHIPFTDDYAQVLQDDAIRIVVICAPTSTHRPLAESALAAGKHVLLEKPIGLSHDDARKLRAAAQASDSILMVGHVVRFFAGYEMLARDIEDGLLGDILTVSADRYVARPAPGRPIYDTAVSGGMLVDLGIHDFEQVARYLGRPQSVRAFGEAVVGPVRTVIEFADGAVATVGTSLSAGEGLAFGSAIEVHGTKGIARYEMIQRRSDTKLAPGAGETTSFYRRVAESGSLAVDLPAEEPYLRQARHFWESIESGATTDDDALENAELALEIALRARDSLLSQQEFGT